MCIHYQLKNLYDSVVLFSLFINLWSCEHNTTSLNSYKDIRLWADFWLYLANFDFI